MTDAAPAANDSVAAEQPLAGERVAFTGTLASMTHRQAQNLVAELGGVATPHVSRQTTILVVGEEGWPLELDGTPSIKLQQVTHWQTDGLAVRILSESDWLTVLGLEKERREVHREYTPAMLSQLLQVPVGVIRAWHRSGLIQPVRQVFRLPYFAFQEVASAQKLAELVAAGISEKQIQASLADLAHLVGNNERPLAQLEILVRDRQLLVRDDAGLLDPSSRQRLLDFDAESENADVIPLAPAGRQIQAHWTADEWLAEAERHLADGELAAAVEAFRLCLTEQPGRAEVHLQLAETLYRLSNPYGALERYHMAVELDPKYLEAWTQLGCVYSELGQNDSAVEAFAIALDVHPDYPDAHFHRAEVLHQINRSAEAVPHWQRYLQFDSRGPWADTARLRLEQLGISGGS